MCEFTTASGPVVISHYENSVRTGICFFSKFGLFVCFVLVIYFLDYKEVKRNFPWEVKILLSVQFCTIPAMITAVFHMVL